MHRKAPGHLQKRESPNGRAVNLSCIFHPFLSNGPSKQIVRSQERQSKDSNRGKEASSDSLKKRSDEETRAAKHPMQHVSRKMKLKTFKRWTPQEKSGYKNRGEKKERIFDDYSRQKRRHIYDYAQSP